MCHRQRRCNFFFENSLFLLYMIEYIAKSNYSTWCKKQKQKQKTTTTTTKKQPKNQVESRVVERCSLYTMGWWLGSCMSLLAFGSVSAKCA